MAAPPNCTQRAGKTVCTVGVVRCTLPRMMSIHAQCFTIQKAYIFHMSKRALQHDGLMAALCSIGLEA